MCVDDVCVNFGIRSYVRGVYVCVCVFSVPMKHITSVLIPSAQRVHAHICITMNRTKYGKHIFKKKKKKERNENDENKINYDELMLDKACNKVMSQVISRTKSCISSAHHRIHTRRTCSVLVCNVPAITPIPSHQS